MGRILQCDIFFGEDRWGGYILNLCYIANQERTTEVQFFYVSLQLTRFCRVESERINRKLDLPPQLQRLQVVMSKVLS